MSLLNGMDEIKTPITHPVVQKSEEYFSYITEHIKNVRKAYEIFIRLDWSKFLTDRELSFLYEKIKTHDNSKFSDEEFEAYRRYFYPVDDEEKEDSKEAFDLAWEHHYRVNDHHPEHWITDGGEKRPMSNIAIIEMMLDWQAMRFKFGGGTCLDYYEENKIKKAEVLHPQTIEKLELYLDYYVTALTED